MAKSKKERLLPISQRELAAYLGVSPSSLNMAETGRHGNRRLSESASAKWAALALAHQKPKKSSHISPSIKKLKAASAGQSAAEGQILLANAEYASEHLALLKTKLAEMIRKQEEGLRWMDTVDYLLKNLPENEATTRERLWLQNQQGVYFKKMKKYGLVSQLKLEIEIETEKTKVRLYRDVAGRLLGI